MSINITAIKHTTTIIIIEDVGIFLELSVGPGVARIVVSDELVAVMLFVVVFVVVVSISVVVAVVVAVVVIVFKGAMAQP